MKIKTFSILTAMLCIFTSQSYSQILDFDAVTDAMLQNPPDEEWLSWRGTPKSWGYSGLDQINTDNVGNLQLVWSWACLLYTSPSPRDATLSRMPSSA